MVLRPESEWWSRFGIVETARDNFTCHCSSLRTQYICTESRVEGRILGACMLDRDHSFCLCMHRIWPPLSPHLFLKPHKHKLCPPSWVVHWDLGQMYGHLLNICTLSYDTGVTLKLGMEDWCLMNHLAVFRHQGHLLKVPHSKALVEASRENAGNLESSGFME